MPAPKRLTSANKRGRPCSRSSNNWLFYVTGGAAFVKETANGTSIAGLPRGSLGFLTSCAESHWRPGFTAGAGFEWGFASNWTAKAEYLYVAAAGTGVSVDHVSSRRH